MLRNNMKLLIVTQVVDSNDPLLGFFHMWLKAFASEFEHITVICLKEGQHDLPDTVRIYSLGKERVIARSASAQGGAARRSNPVSLARTFLSYLVTRLTYLVRFYRLIWTHRATYDAVYVHMNQEYVLFGGLVWRLLGKKVAMWRNHFAGSWRTDLAARFCDKVFCTSTSSYTAHYKNTVFMPVGVSSTEFVPVVGVNRVPASILSLGRISPAKKLGILIEACALLNKRGVLFSCTICGDAQPEHRSYLESLKELVIEKDLSEQVTFVPGVPNYETPAQYSKHTFYVNTSPSGMFDKTMFEAIGCGAILVASSKDVWGKVPEAGVFEEGNAADLARRLGELLEKSDAELDQLRMAQRRFAECHTLARLAERVREELM